MIDLILGSNFSTALGWTIVHSIWQVSLLALIMSVLHRIYRNSTSTVKYNIAVYASLLSLLTSIVTFLIYYIEIDASVAETGSFVGMSLTKSFNSPHSFIDSINSFFTLNMDYINTLWIMGIVVFLLKLIISLGYIRYIKSTTIEFDNHDINQSQLRLLESRLKIDKPISVLQSAKINVPMVIGYLKPVILFPVGMINMLTTDEIEAILVHELFHIKRNDYIINIFLTCIEILYFFHPAMWWIGANIKAERENCCDDAAIDFNIDAIIYAKALVKLDEISKSRKPALAMAFSSPKHHLLNRIKRILNMEQTKNEIREKSIATILLLFVAILFSSNVNSQESEKIENQQSTMEVETESDDLPSKGFDEMNLNLIEEDINAPTQDVDIVDLGKVVNQLDETSSPNNDTETKHFQTLYLKGNPTLLLKDDSLMFFSDQAYFSVDNNEVLDTVPGKKKLKNNKITIIKDNNIEKMEITRENGKVTKIKIDGKEIDESEYDKYQDEIDSVNDNFVFEQDFDMYFPNMDSSFQQSFGMLFDGNMEGMFNEEFFEQLEGLENFPMIELKGLERLGELESLKGLEDLRSLEGLERLEQFENLEQFEGLEEMLDQMGIHLDSNSKSYQFHFDNLEGLDQLQGLHFFDGDSFGNGIESEAFGSSTVVDKLGRALNKDGLLEPYRSNKIELSGKHLKINGEKMPKALFNKYKSIYQEETGAPLTKKSKMIFEIEGKESKRKVRTF